MLLRTLPQSRPDQIDVLAVTKRTPSGPIGGRDARPELFGGVKHDRCGGRDRSLRPNRIGAVLARKRRLAAQCRMIEVEHLELIYLRWRNRKIAVGFPIGRRPHLIEYSSEAAVHRPIAGSLDHKLRNK